MKVVANAILAAGCIVAASIIFVGTKEQWESEAGLSTVGFVLLIMGFVALLSVVWSRKE